MFKFRKSNIKHLLLFDLLLKQDIYFVLSYDFIYKETYLHIINCVILDNKKPLFIRLAKLLIKSAMIYFL
jgi:hypothetical protein